MKKLLSTALILILLLAALLAFTGCNNENKPIEPEDVDLDAMETSERGKLLLEAADRRFSAAESYEEELSADMLSSGTSVVRITGNERFSGIGTDAYKHSSVMTTAVTLYGITVTQTTSEGYGDGYMYSSSVSGTDSLEMKSALTVREYLDYRENSENMPEVDSVDIESNKDEDGTWTVSISGFDTEFVNFFAASTGLSSLTSGIELADITITMELDESFYPESADIGIYYYVKSSYPVETSTKEKLIDMEIEYKNINSATVENPDISDYREIENLAALHSTSTGFLRLGSKTSGHFVYHMHTIRTTPTHTDEQDDRREISYLTDGDGNVEFDMDAVINGDAAYYVYKYGKLSKYSAKGGKLVSNSDITNKDAKAMLLQLQCFHTFDMQQLVDMRLGDKENEFVFTMNLTQSLVNAYTELDLENVKGDKTYEITVILDGYNIVSYTVDMVIEFSNRTYTISGAYEVKE